MSLAGGGTPKLLYQTLAKAPYAQDISWTSVHVFWGDERFVPPDHADSNYRMVREALLERQLMVALAPHLVRPLQIVVPAFAYCGDNAAMIAALGAAYFQKGVATPLAVEASARSQVGS